MEHKVLHVEEGGHDYSARPDNPDCQYHCGCWIGKYQFSAPKNSNLNPFGKCPENPRNKEAKKTLPWER